MKFNNIFTDNILGQWRQHFHTHVPWEDKLTNRLIAWYCRYQIPYKYGNISSDANDFTKEIDNVLFWVIYALCAQNYDYIWMFYDRPDMMQANQYNGRKKNIGWHGDNEEIIDQYVK